MASWMLYNASIPKRKGDALIKYLSLISPLLRIPVEGQRDGPTGKGACCQKPDDLSLILSTHIVKEENWLLKVVL